MAINWTKEQKAVIESRNRNLLVSAAAGSGKTAVLVERIIRMITEGENPLDIDQLLVMTFTKAAADEMRERVLLAVDEKLKEDPENGHLQMQAAMIPYARITTIDSFCLGIIREHYNQLDIAPAGQSLVFEYVDAPGRVGAIGTILGEAGINITTMQIATLPGEQCALVYMNVEGDVDDDVLSKLRAGLGDLKNLWYVKL